MHFDQSYAQKIERWYNFGRYCEKQASFQRRKNVVRTYVDMTKTTFTALSRNEDF